MHAQWGQELGFLTLEEDHRQVSVQRPHKYWPFYRNLTIEVIDGMKP
jgi:hypothetical protein